jgi:hypothetical protein
MNVLFGLEEVEPLHTHSILYTNNNYIQSTYTQRQETQNQTAYVLRVVSTITVAVLVT